MPRERDASGENLGFQQTGIQAREHNVPLSIDQRIEQCDTWLIDYENKRAGLFASVYCYRVHTILSTGWNYNFVDMQCKCSILVCMVHW